MTNRRGKTEGLRDRVAQAAGNGGGEVATTGQPAGPADEIRHLLEKMRPEIAKALPAGMTAERLLRVALTVIRQNPQLLACSQQSLLGALMVSAQLGLEPGPLGHCYLVPFWNNKTRTREVQFIVGYRGMIDLARRSGQLESIEAREVCEGDTFEFAYGLEPKLHHVPALEDRGEAYLYYGVARFTGGGHYFTVMPKSEIEKHRERSQAKDSGPWKTDYDAMARKTVIRAMSPFLPLSIVAAQAMASDEAVHVDISPDMADAVTVPVVPPDSEHTGADAPAEPEGDPCPVCGRVGDDHDDEAHKKLDEQESQS